MAWLIGILTAIFAYLIGSINTSIILSRRFFGSDIRTSGSGNAGTTNMLRTHGKKFAAITLVCDILKGVVAVLLAALADRLFARWSIPAGSQAAAYIMGNLPYIAAFFVVLGHNFPVNWQVGLIALAVALIVMAATAYVSLGSIIGAALFPLLLLAFGLGSGELDPVAVAFAFLLAILIIARHHANIGRLVRGEENKLYGRKK